MAERPRDNADDAWNWSECAAAWRRWHPILTEWWQGVTNLLIAWTEPEPGMRVLDLASGTGEPALTLAARIEPGGTVTATDVIPAMVEIAAENAARRGITSMHFQEADAGALPFPDASFDRVTCRFGVMYFPDVPRALREVLRVLRPGGRATFAVWAAWRCLSCCEGMRQRHTSTPRKAISRPSRSRRRTRSGQHCRSRGRPLPLRTRSNARRPCSC